MGYLLFFLFLSAFHSLASQLPDQPAMMALRRVFSLPEWDSGSLDYCSWRGVTCDSSNGTVVALDLSHRSLRGNISIISQLKSLKYLDLSANSFHGSIPYALGNLPLLEYLDLSMNKFENLIPSSLGGIPNLRSLNLSNNLIAGGIPDSLKGLNRLEELHISGNSLTGSIPLWFSNLPNLRVFSAYENHLVGDIPQRLGSLSQLEVLNLHSNMLSGPIPESIFSSGKLEVLILTMNKLNGTIPNSIGRTRLSNLRVGNNCLTGTIPPAIGSLNSLTYFEVNNNKFSGEIVPDFAKCLNLTLLNLAHNGFLGSVPDELGELKNLQEFIASDNRLTGEIPMSLLKIKNLSKLDLSNNMLNGSLPENPCYMSRMQFLLLNHNFIRGEIPAGIGNCRRLLELQLGSNNLTGEIPHEMGRIRNIQISLNLSSNGLHGSLPRELGKLDKLVSLDLSNNQLSGSIPIEFRGMLSLIDVNFSNNQLTGQVPIFSPFQKSQSSSFLGNGGLCGDPLSLSCEDTDGDDQNFIHHKVSYKIILVVVGSRFAVFSTVTIVVVLFMLRERQDMTMKAAIATRDTVVALPPIAAGNVFTENMRQAIDFNSIIKASLKDSNQLSSGTFSTVYRAVMPSGLILSVKKLKSMDKTVTCYQNKMIRELERLGNLSHKNLVRPIGFVIYDDVALLLHHYMLNGTLAQLIHNEPETERPADWDRRICIATGVAEGLAFLHHVAIIHLDLSSSNVFLDAHFNGLIGEIEISKLLDPSKGTASISVVAGSFGYIPPEYAYTMQVTTSGNVYSYGVILLEILTSRWPVEEAFGEGIDLVKWIHTAPDRGEMPEQIMDVKLSTVSFKWRKQMLEVLKIAMLCTDPAPAKRPTMKKVAEMLLEAIKP